MSDILNERLERLATIVATAPEWTAELLLDAPHPDVVTRIRTLLHLADTMGDLNRVAIFPDEDGCLALQTTNTALRILHVSATLIDASVTDAVTHHEATFTDDTEAVKFLLGLT